jgi:hypothetical protein
MEHRNPSGYHSHKSKSVSILPIHPELDSLHRRSGIRHFSHVPSIRTLPDQEQKLRKFRKKNRAVTGPMQWRNRLNKGIHGGQYTTGISDYRIPETLEEITAATAKEQQLIDNLENMHQRQIRDPAQMMRRVPAPGQGCMLVPQDPGPVHPEYPYPRHIPAAAAGIPPQQHHNQPYPSPVVATSPMFVPFPSGQPTHQTMVPLERIVMIVYGIIIAIAGLFAWIFQKEVIRIGGIVAVVIILWKLGQWNTRVTLENREQELLQQGRLIPAPQPVPVQVGYPYPRMGIVP